MVSFTFPKEKIDTVPPYVGNQISKEYYNFLVVEINNGTIKKAVCKITNTVFNSESYYLISI